ncbi:RNA polymerase sigma factor [Brevundimonas sp.]|uniref:RNA polymerase sigma factor n=1 Tax=Brevundimonas sp. TaxID=1871086 RepID=UPI003D0FC7F4
MALDRDDLVDLYLELRPRLERVIARRTGSLSLAADLAQEMFFKIDTIRAVLPTRTDAERYFLRAAVNASLDHLKIEARRRAILQDEGATLATSTPSSERGMLAREDLRRVEAALSELPEKCRTVFRMSRFDGLSHARIAAELGVSQSLVEKYMVRALLHCRTRLAE